MARFPAPPIARVGAPSLTFDPRAVPGLVAEGLQLDRQRDDLLVSRQLDSVPQDEIVQIVRWGAKHPRWVLVQAVFTRNPPAAFAIDPFFLLTWGAGQASYHASFNRAGPIALMANDVLIAIDTNQSGANWKVAATISAFDGGALGTQGRPLWLNPDNRSRTILAAASETFLLSPHCRRVRVERDNKALSFDVLEAGSYVAIVAANQAHDWTEIVHGTITVTNTGAVGGNFNVEEELAL